jgi:coatomer subunit beta'
MNHELPLSFVEYQIAVVLEEFERAESIFPAIPVEYHSRCARFLEGLGYKEEAIAISTDPDHKFELALQLNRLEEAQALAETEKNDPEGKWKRVGELALLNGQFQIAESCMLRCDDLNGLLLMYTSLSVPKKIEELAVLAKKSKKMNISFLCHFLLNDLDACLATLIDSGRISEAAFFARTYCPSKISEIVELWKKDLAKVSKVAA